LWRNKLILFKKTMRLLFVFHDNAVRELVTCWPQSGDLCPGTL